MKFIRLGGFTINVDDISYIMRKEITHCDNTRGIKAIIKLNNGEELSTTDIDDEAYEKAMNALTNE